MDCYFLCRESRKDNGQFPNVTIRDRSQTVPATIDGRATRVYAPVSEIMPYLDAYPIMARMNREWQETERAATARSKEECTNAAAPELLTTLESVSRGLRDCEYLARKSGDNGTANLIREKIDWISAAIAKATGKDR